MILRQKRFARYVVRVNECSDGEGLENTAVLRKANKISDHMRVRMLPCTLPGEHQVRREDVERRPMVSIRRFFEPRPAYAFHQF